MFVALVFELYCGVELNLQSSAVRDCPLNSPRKVFPSSPERSKFNTYRIIMLYRSVLECGIVYC